MSQQVSKSDFITKPALKRIMRKSQVERVNGLVFSEMRRILKISLETIIRDIFTIVLYSKRKTAMLNDFYTLTSLRHTPVAIGINKDLKSTKSLKLVRSFDVTPPSAAVRAAARRCGP